MRGYMGALAALRVRDSACGWDLLARARVCRCMCIPTLFCRTHKVVEVVQVLRESKVSGSLHAARVLTEFVRGHQPMVGPKHCTGEHTYHHVERATSCTILHTVVFGVEFRARV